LNIGELATGIDTAYARLGTAHRQLVAATEALSNYERRAKVENADILLEAKNERTATLYLDGILDTPEHTDLSAAKTQAELAHYEARLEIQRLELLVRLLEVREGV
jgi:uncharacterized protein YfdQ (DUF2303 family)